MPACMLAKPKRDIHWTKWLFTANAAAHFNTAYTQRRCPVVDTTSSRRADTLYRQQRFRTHASGQMASRTPAGPDRPAGNSTATVRRPSSALFAIKLLSAPCVVMKTSAARNYRFPLSILPARGQSRPETERGWTYDAGSRKRRSKAVKSARVGHGIRFAHRHLVLWIETTKQEFALIFDPPCTQLRHRGENSRPTPRPPKGAGGCI